jgi:hypothetical protein
MYWVSAVTRQGGEGLLTLCRGSGCLSLLAGPPGILDLGTTLAGHVVLAGATVLYVDGANAFDPYIIARLAREAGRAPKPVMQRLHLSRAFTCHQLETLLTERLPGAITHYHPALVLLSGWSHLFHDENVPAREAFRLLQNTVRRVRALAEAGQPFLATHPESPVTSRLRPLEAILVDAADAVIRLYEEAGRILAVREKPADGAGPRPLPVSDPEGCPWIPGHRHQQLPVAYPWTGR